MSKPSDRAMVIVSTMWCDVLNADDTEKIAHIVDNAMKRTCEQKTELSKQFFPTYVKNSIKLVSGKYLNLVYPQSEHISIDDIAGALGKICRFGGQCPLFYSVAEHSYHCAALAIKDNLPTECVRAVFLHDAAEAYVGDMVTPLKVLLPDYSKIELGIQSAISEVFGVDFNKWNAEIQAIDRAVLIAERNRLWPIKDGVQWTNESECRSVTIQLRLLNSAEATQWFLEMWRSIEAYNPV